MGLALQRGARVQPRTAPAAALLPKKLLGRCTATPVQATPAARFKPRSGARWCRNGRQALLRQSAQRAATHGSAPCTDPGTSRPRSGPPLHGAPRHLCRQRPSTRVRWLAPDAVRVAGSMAGMHSAPTLQRRRRRRRRAPAGNPPSQHTLPPAPTARPAARTETCRRRRRARCNTRRL